MLEDIIVIDNFFKDPGSIVGFANQQIYIDNEHKKTRSHWRGQRTNELFEINFEKALELSQEFFDNLFYRNFIVNPEKYTFNYNMQASFFFHRLDETNNLFYRWIHKDKSIYAGVVYLNENPPDDSGTFLIKDDSIVPYENKYNRLVLYNSEYLHSPMSGFGKGENSRLTLTMFISKIDIKMEKLKE